MDNPSIVFFDFDGTLVRGDSFISFARYACGSPRLAGALVLASPWLAGWKLGLLSNSTAKQHLFSLLYRGMPLERFRELGREFAGYLDRCVRPEVMEILESHMREGAEAVIVTASVLQWVAPWAHSHGISSVIATEPEVDSSGYLTGRFATPNCHGAEKAVRIRAAYPDVDSRVTFAYGDSGGDAGMFALASGHMKV